MEGNENEERSFRALTDYTILGFYDFIFDMNIMKDKQKLKQYIIKSSL